MGPVGGVFGTGSDQGHGGLPGRLIGIVAGYSEPMQAFLQSNPGLQSRFNQFIAFPDYSATERKAIVKARTVRNLFDLAVLR